MTVDTLSQVNVQHHDRLQALYQMAVELSALRSLESVLDTALQHCLALTDSEFGFVGLTTPNGKAMDVVATRGFHPAGQFYKEHHLIPLRPNIFACVVLDDRPVRSSDAMSDPRRVGQPGGHPPVGTFLGVPLRLRNNPIGMIGVANRPQPYNDDHEQLLMTYAAQLAIVISNAQLYEQLTAANEELERKVTNRTHQLQDAKEALAQKAIQLQHLLAETADVEERERQRIAQDMHDGINQLLVGGLLELKSARERLDTGNLERADESLQAVQDILHRVEAEIRQIIYDLRPPTLDALGLVPALRRYAERFEQYSGISCTMQVSGPTTRLTPNTEICIYRLMQEALQNVSTHAHAKNAGVKAEFSLAQFKLVITDDGQGFDLETMKKNNADHFGLLNMRERAERLGGDLDIQTGSGCGTQVDLIVPIKPDLLLQPGA